MNTMTTKEKMYQQISEHGENLNRIFHTEFEPLVLCKKLHQLELKAHKLAEDYCNGLIETDDWESVSIRILGKVNNILKFREQGIPVIFNGDPRGYALKISEEWVTSQARGTIYTDWGGYGIIAPEFDGRE